MPFILLAYAPDESIGAEIEKVKIARATAANRLKEILFIFDVLPLFETGRRGYGRVTRLNSNDSH